MTLTSEEYLTKQGVICPNCQSHNINSNEIRHEGNHISVNVDCDACGATWLDIFELANYDNLELPHANWPKPPSIDHMPDN